MPPPLVDVGERFGQAVRQRREARGWSQQQLARRAGLNRSYMGEVERAAVMPSLATASKLADALELPLSHLLSQAEGGEESEPEQEKR
ncbi:MAG: helix-turn-helix transcriptional regulator [Piscinibacter sp.]